MKPKLIQAPIDEPVSIEEARAHIEAQPYFDSDVDPIDDAMIEGWIGAAREHCENFLGLSLSTRVLEIALDAFPTHLAVSGLGIELPMGPVREILSVRWGTESDEELEPEQFVLDDYGIVARIVPAGSVWPSMTPSTNAVKVQYLAGYGVDSDGGEPLPRAIRAAMLLMIGHLYAHREDVSDGVLTSIPNGTEALLRPLRVRLGMA